MQLLVADLGTLAYAESLAIQRAVAMARIGGDIEEDVLLLVEHPPVVTLGRATRAGNLLASPELLATRGVELFEVDRGGDVTFHGPGQLVGYPIVDLKRHRRDLHWYLRQLEAALIHAVAPFGIAGERSVGQTGVWTRDRKLASIGVHAREWVTWHGFALNVTTDLSYFDLIVPCGISEVTMTSVARELGADVMEYGGLAKRARTQVVGGFSDIFGLDAVGLPATELLDGLRLESP
jgi:lipoyl(octanoyl) transferase